MGHVCICGHAAAGSVLISMAHITTREHGDIRGRGSYWGPCGRPGVVQSCLHLSLAVALWRVGFISLTVKGPCTSPREHHGVGPGSWGLGEVIPTPLPPPAVGKTEHSGGSPALAALSTQE